MDVFDELVRLRALGQKCALATIVEVRGSIPSYESAKLLVREDGSMLGTNGGGYEKPKSGMPLVKCSIPKNRGASNSASARMRLTITD
ncbi:MAG: XdhC family protein [Bryobacteraceae bacterium]